MLCCAGLNLNRSGDVLASTLQIAFQAIANFDRVGLNAAGTNLDVSICAKLDRPTAPISP
jgi:hypothetical protein